MGKKPFDSRTVQAAAAAVPYSWLDELLTGPKRVVSDRVSGQDVERLCRAIRDRILTLSPQE